MGGMTFTQGSGLNDSIFGKAQAPIRLFIEQRGEAFDQMSLIKPLFQMGSSTNFGEMMTSMTAMDGFQAVGENGATPRDEMQEGYGKFLKHMTWKNSFALSREIIEDSKLMDLKKRPEAFISGYNRTRERYGAALYAGAIAGNAKIKYSGKEFDTTGADGKVVFDTTHPSKVKGASQSNKFSNVFSDDALGLLETRMQNFMGDNGEILDVTPDTIVIPNVHALKKAVFAAVGADKDPTTANNGFNYQFGRWNIICWPYLNNFIAAGTLPWILLDSKYNDMNGGAVWLDRTKLDVHSEVDRNTHANVWSGYSRFVAGFHDWRFAAVAGVTGGTTLS